jgi:hypothetical protein
LCTWIVNAPPNDHHTFSINIICYIVLPTQWLKNLKNLSMCQSCGDWSEEAAAAAEGHQSLHLNLYLSSEMFFISIQLLKVLIIWCSTPNKLLSKLQKRASRKLDSWLHLCVKPELEPDSRFLAKKTILIRLNVGATEQLSFFTLGD